MVNDKWNKVDERRGQSYIYTAILLSEIIYPIWKIPHHSQKCSF